MAYTTEGNTIRQRRYREKHREQYAEYQRKYKEENYGNPTIRLAQVRENLRRCKLNLIKWEQEEADLLIAQKKMQQERKQPELPEQTLFNWFTAQE